MNDLDMIKELEELRSYMKRTEPTYHEWDLVLEKIDWIVSSWEETLPQPGGCEHDLVYTSYRSGVTEVECKNCDFKETTYPQPEEE